MRITESKLRRLIKETLLQEAAYTSDSTTNVFYHGTSNEAAAQRIAKEGIQPPEQKERKGWLKPVDGAVYLTPDLGYALIYALGADMAESTMSDAYMRGSRYGYIFEVPSQQLKDVQPDEDSVGEMLDGGNPPPWLVSMFKRHVSPSWQEKLLSHEYIYYARVGKMLIKRMADWQKLELIQSGTNVAHMGPVFPTKCWKVDKQRSKELKRDGSNFFQIAEECQL